MGGIRRGLFGTICWVAAGVSAATAQTAPYGVIHSFGAAGTPTKGGEEPNGGLLSMGDNLYGVTLSGGVCCGTIFVINRLSLATKIVYSFTAESGIAGFSPIGRLLNVGGLLYGATEGGGIYFNAGGTIFSFNPASAKQKIIHPFSVAANGVSPNGDLIKVNGLLYGTTNGGGTAAGAGSYPIGTIFSMTPYAGTETVLHSFQSTNGEGDYPVGGLTNVRGILYGLTTHLGSNGYGTVYSLELATGTYKVVHSFQSGADGAYPYGELVDVSGTLYGATSAGGGAAFCQSGCGTLFSLNPATGAETVLYAFQGGSDGNYPQHGSLIGAGGKLYGTTYYGGAAATTESTGQGTVFSFDLATGTKTVLHAFLGGRDGAYPLYGLIHVGGQFYGTTVYGGEFDFGTIFEVTP